MESSLFLSDLLTGHEPWRSTQSAIRNQEVHGECVMGSTLIQDSFFSAYLSPHLPHLVSCIPHPTSRILHPASRIPHPASRIAHPASRILHPASRILHPVSCIL